MASSVCMCSLCMSAAMEEVTLPVTNLQSSRRFVTGATEVASKAEATARNCNCEALADHEEETDLWTAARTLRELEHQTRTAGRCTSTMVTRGRATTCAEVRKAVFKFQD